MELSRMEKRMLYQTEGCDRYAVLNELSISSGVVSRYLRKGLFYEARYKDEAVCVFVGRDDAGKARFACMRGIADSLKKDVAGHDKKFSFCYPPEDLGSGQLAVFEALIDALSHAQGTVQENTGTVCFKAIPDTTKSPVLEDPVKSVWDADGRDITNRVINDGQDITYTVTFRNPADEAKAFTVTDELPEEVSLVEGTVSDGGRADDRMITWKMTLAAGEEKTVSFDVHVPERESEYTKIYNQADVSVDLTHKASVSFDSVLDERTPVMYWMTLQRQYSVRTGMISAPMGKGTPYRR